MRGGNFGTGSVQITSNGLPMHSHCSRHRCRRPTLYSLSCAILLRDFIGNLHYNIRLCARCLFEYDQWEEEGEDVEKNAVLSHIVVCGLFAEGRR